MTPPTPTRRDVLRAAGALALAPGVDPPAAAPAGGEVKVVVWDERQPSQRPAYADFLGGAVAGHLKSRPGLSVRSVGLDDPGRGLTDEVLGDARVLVWWGHARQDEVAPEVGRKVVGRVKAGTLALLALHSAHWSTPFVEAMNERARLDAAKASPGAEVRDVPPPKRYTLPNYETRLTPYALERRFPDGAKTLDLHLPLCVFPAYRNDGKPSFVRVLKPAHPIAEGLPATFEIPREEMYDEPFHVPEPDEVILEERWATGEWFRSGMLWKLGAGHVFYFRPGHETYPTYTQAEPLRVVANAVAWLGSKTARPA